MSNWNPTTARAKAMDRLEDQNTALRARVAELEQRLRTMREPSKSCAPWIARVAEYHTAVEIAYDFLVGAGFDMESVPLRKITALAKEGESD